MGIKVGPDGLIWYVNSVTDKVMRITQAPVSVAELDAPINFNISPNPANAFVNISYSQTLQLNNPEIQILDISGRIIFTKSMGLNNSVRVETNELAAGVYLVRMLDGLQELRMERLVIAK